MGVSLSVAHMVCRGSSVSFRFCSQLEISTALSCSSTWMMSTDISTTETLPTYLIIKPSHVVSDQRKFAEEMDGLYLHSLCLELVLSPKLPLSFLYWQRLYVLEIQLKTTEWH